MSTRKEPPAKSRKAKTVVPTRKVDSATTEQSGQAESCFTIMPFGGWFDEYYESIYLPAIYEAGLQPRRADDLYRPSTIVHDIWSCTKGARLVLADLTGRNPNVFYELGLAHALAKPVVLVTESLEDVPFDLRALRIIEYNKNEPRWGDSLRDKVTKSIKEVLDSPLVAVLPAFLEPKPRTEATPLSESDLLILELRREVDLLRREVAGAPPQGTTLRQGLTTHSAQRAREFLRELVRRGSSEIEVLNETRSRFPVSGSWVLDELARIDAEKRLIERTSDPRESPPEADLPPLVGGRQ